MGYRKIRNLYKHIGILNFKKLYALEKIHGTSAHISYEEERPLLHFFSGGASHQMFIDLFNHKELYEKFKSLGYKSVTVYGEAYGGKLQGMKNTYGKDLKFVAFEVAVPEWLNVPDAEKICQQLGIEFVHYELIDATTEEINRVRDEESIQAIRNGCGHGKVREGVVLRPVQEAEFDGERIIAKHKSDSFKETRTPRELDPEKLVILTKSKEIADEWVTEMRLDHVLGKLPHCISPADTKMVIEAMLEDIRVEAEGEIILSKEAEGAIKTKSAKLFISRLKRGME